MCQNIEDIKLTLADWTWGIGRIKKKKKQKQPELLMVGTWNNGGIITRNKTVKSRLFHLEVHMCNNQGSPKKQKQ